jgi:trigger factor
VLPELTDEWVQENSELESVDALLENQRQGLEQNRLAAARELLLERATSALAELVDEDPPEALVAPELRRRAENTVARLQSQGIDIEQFFAATGQTQEGFLEQLRSAAVTAVKVDLALRAIADAEELEVTDDDLANEYARIATVVRDKPAAVRRAYEREGAVSSLRAELRKRRALEWLLRHVEVVDPDGKEIDRSRLLPDDAIGDADIVEAAGTETPDTAEEGEA